ncbi:MAG: hypothetical protein ACXVCH_06165, partial [Bdellovibrionota bacterium]
MEPAPGPFFGPVLDKTHPQSLLRIPLVKQMLTDPRIPLVPRNIDQDWRYLGVIPDSVVGFNPQRSSVYYARKSYFAEWLEQPRRSTRELNEQDYLVREVLFAVHDYLHAWAYLAIRELTPK